jgi:hypothetical protein
MISKSLALGCTTVHGEDIRSVAVGLREIIHHDGEKGEDMQCATSGNTGFCQRSG